MYLRYYRRYYFGYLRDFPATITNSRGRAE